LGRKNFKKQIDETKKFDEKKFERDILRKKIEEKTSAFK
jgi:hypothetical protein